jgi:WD40 repeat protein
VAVDGDQNGKDRVKVWDVATARRKPLEVEILSLCACFSPSGHTLLVGGGHEEGLILLLDAATGKERATLKGHRSTVYCLAFAPGGKVLASGSHDLTAKLWDWKGGRELATLKVHKGTVLSVAFAPDGKSLATAGGDGVLKLWDLESDKPPPR